MKLNLMSYPELLNEFIINPTQECSEEIANRSIGIFHLMTPDSRQQISEIDYFLVATRYPQRIRGSMESYVQ